jgi:DNA-directed RNA polymerase subunit RPC12/RpoP
MKEETKYICSFCKKKTFNVETLSNKEIICYTCWIKRMFQLMNKGIKYG